MYNESYFCNCSGTNTTCFTFYTDFERSFKHSEVLEAVVLSVILLVSLVTNSLVVYVIYKLQRSPGGGSITNYFVANLAVADLLFALTIPAVAAARVATKWQLGQAGCKLTIYLQCLCGSVVIWSLCLISVDRFRLIVVPPFRRRFTSRQVAVAIGCSWAAFLVLHTPMLVLFDREYGYNVSVPGWQVEICTMVPQYGARYGIAFVAVVSTTIFVLPTSIFVFNYVSIYRKLVDMMRQRQQQHCSRLSTVTPPTEIAEPSSEVSSVEDRPAPPKEQREPDTRQRDTVVTLVGSASDLDAAVTRPNGLWSRARSYSTLLRLLGTVDGCGRRRGSETTTGSVTTRTLHTTGARLCGGGSEPCLTRSSLDEGLPDPADRHLRALRILVLEVVVYLLMWLPISVLLVVMYFESELECEGRSVDSHHFFYCLVLAYANTCVNPILYGVLNENFRDSLRQQFWCCGGWWPFSRRRHEDTVASQSGL